MALSWANRQSLAREVKKSKESLFRVGIFGELLSSVTFIFLIMVLYRLLSGVNKTYASLMVILVLVSVTAGFVNSLNNIAALRLFRGGDLLAVFDNRQRDARPMPFLGLHQQGLVVNEIFWGLWRFPFGLRVFRSGFFPRILG